MATLWSRVAFRLRRGGKDKGSSILEAAIVLPVVVLLVMTTVQAALVWHGRDVAQAAARAGAQAGAVYRAGQAAGSTAARSYLAAVAPNLLTGPSVSSSRSLDTVTVTVTAGVISLVPFATFGVAESASAPQERFVAGPP